MQCCCYVSSVHANNHLKLHLKSKGAARKDEKSIDEAGDKSLTKKKKKKKESSQSSTSVEKRRDQPLLLEFESLFNSLQVCSCIIPLSQSFH